MGRLLVDKLLSGPTSGEATFEHIKDTLRLPVTSGQNHCHAESGAYVDRVVFDQAAYDAAVYPLAKQQMSIGGIWECCRFPSEPLWIECGDEAWLLGGNEQRVGPTRVLYFCNLPRLGVLSLGVCTDTDIRSEVLDASYHTGNLNLIRSIYPTSDEEDVKLKIQHGLLTLPFLLTALAAPRVTSLRRVVKGGEGSASRVLARRRFQIGRPMFSYNKVEMVLPKTALHRGVLREVPDHPGVRQHLVIGHWRLIDGAIEPYWIWVDGHYRGDPSLGQIVKERHVRFTSDVRRGFLVPDGAGLSGERRKAARP